MTEDPLPVRTPKDDPLETPHDPVPITEPEPAEVPIEDPVEEPRDPSEPLPMA